MMVLGISWLWWAAGTFGLVGTGLMLWLAPAVVVKVVSSLLTFFLTNRYGNMIAVGLIVFFVADVNRSMRDANEFAARTANFEQAQKARDARIRQETRESVQAEIAIQTISDADSDKTVKDFTDGLPKTDPNSNPFRIGADACKLRHIAGQAECGSGRHQGVPAARKPPDGIGDHGRFRLPKSFRPGVG